MRLSLKKHRWMLGVWLAAVVCAAVLVVQTVSDAAEIPPSPMSMQTCLECGYDCGIGEHIADLIYMTELPTNLHRKNHPDGDHDCGGGDSCIDHHPAKCDPDDGGGCGPLCRALASQETTSQVWATLTSNDTEAIMRAVVAYGAELEFNSERNAFQSVDCAGMVVLHVPLEPETADAVRGELEALEELEVQEAAR